MSHASVSTNDQDIVHLEQRVNDRFGTDPAPPLPTNLLPENGQWQPMAWAELASSEISLLCDDKNAMEDWREMLQGSNGTVRFPIHPLVEPQYRNRRIVRSGSFAVSASYRTVFFRPEHGSALARGVPDDSILMLKLHLDDPLPGIPGDRRLTRDKMLKCIQLSELVPACLRASRFVHPLEVLRERAGVIHGDRGAILRIVPRKRFFPLFALYSRDSQRPDDAPLLVRELENRGISASQCAESFGQILAEPLLRALFAAFDQGFSLEMHAQNVLGSSSPHRLLESVLFRDLESVQYFAELRAARGHAKTHVTSANPELIPHPAVPARWFNRNVDHDIGRVLRGALATLRNSTFLSDRQFVTAVHSCRHTHHALVNEFGLHDLDGWGRLFPLARAPYRRFWSRGGYYKTQFR